MAKSQGKLSSKTETKELPTGVIGTSLGTLYLLLVNNISQAGVLKTWLLGLAPTISLIISKLVKELDTYYKRKKLEVLKVRFTNQINQQLQNPSTTPQKKKELEQALEEINMVEIEELADKIKRITIEIHS